MKPTADRVRTILDYDRHTGIFKWRVRADRPTQWNSRYAGTVAGRPDSSGYWQIYVDGKRYFSAHLAWLVVTGDWPAGLLDHKDTVRSNNAFDNLRPATHTMNMQNRGAQSDNKCGIKGVHYRPNLQKWVAQITAEGRQMYLGLFATSAEAASAYAAAAKRYHGEFARTE